MIYFTNRFQFGKQQITSNFDIIGKHNENEINQAIQAQSEIGWDQFFKGRISKKWGDIQQAYYDRKWYKSSCHLKNYHDRQWWTVYMIKQIVYLAFLMRGRCEKINITREKKG